MAALPSFSISLAGRVGHLFDPQTILQGFVCHTKGVELTSHGKARIDARVKGKRTHAVALASLDGALSVACSCPAKSYGQSYCKHLWAALLEVDRHGGLDELRTTRAPLDVIPSQASASASASEPTPGAPPAAANAAAKKTPEAESKKRKKAKKG